MRSDPPPEGMLLYGLALPNHEGCHVKLRPAAPAVALLALLALAGCAPQYEPVEPLPSIGEATPEPSADAVEEIHSGVPLAPGATLAEGEWGIYDMLAATPDQSESVPVRVQLSPAGADRPTDDELEELRAAGESYVAGKEVALLRYRLQLLDDFPAGYVASIGNAQLNPVGADQQADGFGKLVAVGIDFCRATLGFNQSTSTASGAVQDGCVIVTWAEGATPPAGLAFGGSVPLGDENPFAANPALLSIAVE
ncbi:hypothetical protein AVP42_00619 [Agromyces sp. NDB4Y10]|nr:hypothetical protein AVP42_00619 [Agromyces sp. NDB4Y10]